MYAAIGCAPLHPCPRREQLRRVLQADGEYGATYKLHLPANRQWLEKAARRGVLLAAWLRPRSSTAVVEGRKVIISVADDPCEIFLMGSYFNTCLSVGNYNQMSVLANAHDANKQVLFMHDAQGNVLARQLVAISCDFALLGYHCYAGIDHRQTSVRELYIAAMASFCGRWAHGCGLSLADEGEPDEIADHFWYDDGAHPWHDDAKQAWAAERAVTRPALSAQQISARTTAPMLT